MISRMREKKGQKSESKERKRFLEYWRSVGIYLILYDVIVASLAYLFALWIRYDFMFSRIPKGYLDSYVKFIPWYAVGLVFIFWTLHLYKSIWRFASFDELHRLIIGSCLTSVIHITGMEAFVCKSIPFSYFLFGAILQFIMTSGIRFIYRFHLLLSAKRGNVVSEHAKHNVMVIGAGRAGKMIISDLICAKESMGKACCIIDDDPNKWGCYLEGVPIVGGRDDILANVEKYKIDQILFAIPTATASEKRDILNVCQETGCELKSLPGVMQLVNGEVSLTKVKDVAVEELLGRDPIKVNMEEVYDSIKGKVILVTGGGGSIGSELCRQIAAQEPEHLIIFDCYENNAYEIEQELKREYPELHLTTLIGSVRDSRKMDSVFETYKPEIVYHAAAHKHVPLMETSPCEAIKNNVLGTYKTAYAALNHDCRKFVLISTDKAVNPTNIMGASKRLCEMVIQSMDEISKSNRNSELPALSQFQQPPMKKKKCVTEFVAVRFGNVLGSNGSVIPLFKKQIENGGPVTVTHPDIIRYFMTIPEAVSLVLQAGTYAKGGEIFVLDMGAPVKIDTLARNLIKLSGHKPDGDIKIVYSGLRPGEKLYEEKLMEEEGLKTTPNHLIHIGSPIPFDVNKFLDDLCELTELSYSNSDKTISLVAEMVQTYHTAESDLDKNSNTFHELYNEAIEGKKVIAV